MENKSNYRTLIGSISIAAGLLALACILVGAMAVDYNFDAFSDPTLVLQYAKHYKAAYWFLLLDLFGYYLLLLPVIFYLHQQYRFQSPWVQLYSFSGLGYVLTGAIGAAILAAAWPQLMQLQLLATGDSQASLQLVFNVMTQVVTKGLWNILEVLFAACWWTGFGALLYRDHKALGITSLVAGLACLADGIGTIADWKLLSEAGVNSYLLVGVIWPIQVGIHLLRKPAGLHYRPQAARSTPKADTHALA